MPKKTPWLLYGFAVLFGLVLVICATVAITFWWMQRPIKPVVLSPAEKAAVEQKLQHLGGGDPTTPRPIPVGMRRAEADESLRVAAGADTPRPVPDRAYVPGSKVLRLTERELNGLLNANTELGRSVRLQFGKDAINAYLAVPIPEDFPIGGGKMFRARGQFRVSLGNGGAAYAILEDVTIFGLSLPKAWLGGLKGENLIGAAMGEGGRPATFKGIKSLRVEPGALVLEVED